MITRLKRYWSPEIIAGRLKKFGIKISYETIYQYIYDGNRQLTEYLPKKHIARKRIWQYRKRKKSNIPNRIDIDLRPIEANERLEFGHFEADTILSSKKSKSALLVLVDCKTRYTKIKKLDKKCTNLTSSLIVSALSEFNFTQIHSITYDNGCEFVNHEYVNQNLVLNHFSASLIMLGKKVLSKILTVLSEDSSQKERILIQYLIVKLNS